MYTEGEKYVDSSGNVVTPLYVARHFSTMESMIVYIDSEDKILVAPANYFYDNHVICNDCTTTTS